MSVGGKSCLRAEQRRRQPQARSCSCSSPLVPSLFDALHEVCILVRFTPAVTQPVCCQ